MPIHVHPPPPAPSPPPLPPVAGLASLFVGLAMATLGTLAASTGHVLFRLSSTVESDVPLMCRWRFFIACFLVVVVLSTCNGIALALAPLSMIAPFAGISMVWSVWFGHCGLFGVHEPLARLDVAWTALVLAGVVLVSWSESVGVRHKLSEADLLADAAEPLFIYCWLAFVLAGFGWLLLPISNQLRASYPVAATFTSALLGAAAAAFTQSFAKLSATAIALSTEPGASDGPPAWFVGLAVCGLVTSAPLDLLLLSRTIMAASLVLAVPLY